MEIWFPSKQFGSPTCMGVPEKENIPGERRDESYVTRQGYKKKDAVAAIGQITNEWGKEPTSDIVECEFNKKKYQRFTSLIFFCIQYKMKTSSLCFLLLLSLSLVLWLVPSTEGIMFVARHPKKGNHHKIRSSRRQSNKWRGIMKYDVSV